MNDTTKSQIEFLRKVQNVASSVFDLQASNNLLFSLNNILSRRAQLALYIVKGKMKDNDAAIEEYNHLNKLIIQHLNL